MNNVTVLRLHRAPEFDTPRARARPHTLASFPPDEVRGEGRSCCVGSGIYVYM
nr:MAG TPA: hypothetical protein [Caudoviricetes sp.]